MILSIILPVYNVEKYLTKSLDSLVHQELDSRDYEIIIVNDGSTDDSGKIANEYAMLYAHIQVVNQPNKGVGAARNKGLSLAKGRYVYFIDPDDYLCSNILKILLGYAEKMNAEIIGFESLSTTSYDLYTSTTTTTENLDIPIENGISYIANNMFKNEIWWYFMDRKFLLASHIKFIEGRWMEDAIFTVSILLKANRVCFVPIDSHRHVKVPDSAMTNRESAHFNKVIYDNANAAKVYAKIIQELEVNVEHELCVKRLKKKQELFVFFLTARAYKSNLSFKELWDILLQMKEINAYPLKKFIGNEYNGFIFKSTSFFFNNKLLLYLSYNSFQIIKRII